MAATARATINVAMSGNRRIRPTDPSHAWLGAIANGPRVPCDDIPGSITLHWRREAFLPPPQWLEGSRAACAPRAVDEKTRSAERPGGKACVDTCRSRCAPTHQQQHIEYQQRQQTQV